MNTERKSLSFRDVLAQHGVSGIDVKRAHKIGSAMQNQIRRAMQMFAQTVTDEQAMEIADLYPAWEAGKAYAVGTIVKYGESADGETRLYRVVQEHTSQADCGPDTAPALFSKIGFTEKGVPILTQKE